MNRRIKTLLFSSLYPNAVASHHGIFVETRLRHLLASGEIETKVVAPVPWFPSANPNFGAYADYARVPKQENRHDINIFHPRYPLLPKIGMNLAPISLAAASMPIIKQLIRQGRDFDIIDAHYFYPDGVAAAFIGRQLGKPVVITARGSDINQIPQHNIPRKMIRWAANQAAGLITVCQALKDAMVDLGISPDKIVSLRNGVDLNLFQPIDRESQRTGFGIKHPTLLSVGHLIPRKGHDLVIQSLPMLPEFRLLIAGNGPEQDKLTQLANRLNVANRVTFLGALAQNELKNYYGAVDALVLASSREGWANVLLEAMACGTPVIASNVWGTPEVVASSAAGILMAERSPQGIADAVRKLFSNYPEHAATRSYAEKFGWEDTTAGQLALFKQILGRTATSDKNG